MEKSILLIDDGVEHIQTLQSIKKYLSESESISLVTKYINPNDRAYLDDDKFPDLKKLIDGIQSKLASIKPNLIVVDQYYSDNNKFKGLDVIEELRLIPKFRKCSIFIISGNRKRIVSEIFNAAVDESEKVNRLAKIINLKIESFLDKDFKSDAIKYLKQTKLDEVLPTKLRDYESENPIINRFTPKYNTLTFSELADKIEGDTPDAKEILDEMFGLTLSYYASINEKL